MSLKKQAISGVVWTFAQQFSVQLINFVVQIILARLLMPEMFGLIAMLSVFISIGETLMNGGMTSSLIRTNNPDQMDYSTVFMTNMIISILVYLLTFFAAPLIAKFYDQEVLENILRIYALTFVIRAFVAVHIAKLTKEMNFKTQMKLQVPSTIIGAIVGISMAYMDYGVWSLVWLNLTQSLVFTIQSWLFIKWRPSFDFDKKRFKHHFNFGYKMTFSSLLNTIYNDTYRIIIGKYFSAIQVGFYNQAENIRRFPVQQLSTVLDKVTYPLFSEIKKDSKLKVVFRDTMKLSFLIVIPLMSILILISEELFFVVFGEKWLPAVPYFKILALASIIRPLTTYNLNILKVKGRSDLHLKLDIYNKIIGVLAIVIALPHGMIALLYSYVISYYMMAFLNMYISGKLIKYSVIEQLTDIWKLFIIGVLSYLTCRYLHEFFIKMEYNIWYILTIIPVVFMIVYTVMIIVFEKRLIQVIKNLRS